MSRNLNHVDNWLIRCVKGQEEWKNTSLGEAIKAAREMDSNLQPIMGVDIWSDDFLICTINGNNIDWAELED